MATILRTPLRLAGAASVLAAALAAPALAAPQDAGPDETATVLHLTETADRQIPRDRLHAQLRVEATGSSAKQVQADINKRMASALERARAVTGIKVESGGYSVYEEHQQNGGARWHGSQTLSLYGSDFAALLGVAGELQNDGLAMSQLAFELAPETARAAQDDLTAEALRRLHDRAERVAADLQMTVLRYHAVRVGNVVGLQPPVPFQMRAMAAAKAPEPVGELGDARVQISVDADVLLTPADSHQP